MSKIHAVSFERYNGGVRVKRQYGSSTVTRFYVYRDEDQHDPSKWHTVEGFGPTPGDRKTDAIRRSGLSASENPLLLLDWLMIAGLAVGGAGLAYWGYSALTGSTGATGAAGSKGSTKGGKGNTGPASAAAKAALTPQQVAAIGAAAQAALLQALGGQSVQAANNAVVAASGGGITSTVGAPPSGKVQPPGAATVLLNGQSLSAGQSIVLPAGTSGGVAYPIMHLDMQTDGNLVLYSGTGTANVLWASNTAGTGSTNEVTIQPDGNLVMYPGPYSPGISGSLWASNSVNNDSGSYLALGPAQVTLYSSLNITYWNAL
jgi:hypothetical protein